MPSHTQSIGFGKTEAVLVILIIVYLFLLLYKLPLTPFYYENDQLILLENADRMMRGDALYRDFFQFTFPGGQVLYCLLFSVFGTSYWLAGLVAIIAGTGSFCACLAISKHLIRGPFAILPATIYGFFGLRWFGLEGTHRVLSAMFVWIALLVLIKWPRRYALAGFFCALSSFFLQNRGIAVVAAFGLFILFENYAIRKDWRSMLKSSLSLAIGFFTSLVLLCSYFIVTAGPGIYIWSTFTYPATYYKYYEQNNYGAYLANLQRSFSPEATLFEFMPALFYSLVVPLAIAAFFAVYWKYRRKLDWDIWRGPMLVAMVGAVLVTTTSGPNYLRFFHISVPALVLLVWLVDYFKIFQHRQKLLVLGVIVPLITSSALIAIRFQARSDYVKIDAPRGTVAAAPSGSTDRYLWLQHRTHPGDYVYEVYPSYVYFLLGLRSGSRFQQILQTEYTRPEFVVGVVEDLARTKPNYVLWNNDYSAQDETRVPGDNVGPLAEYIDLHYAPAGPQFMISGQPIQVWERK